MSSRVSILSVAFFLMVVFFSSCDGSEKEASLRQTFMEQARTNNIRAALNAFEQLFSDYSVTGPEVIEAASLMLFCEGEIEKASAYLDAVDPSGFLQKESYTHVPHADAEAVRQLNYHYYRSYFYLRSFLACTTSGYERCQSVIQSSLDKLSENTGVNPIASDRFQYFEISELLEIQSMPEESVRSLLQQRISESIRQCQSIRVDRESG